MSSFRVESVSVSSIMNHPNADRLDLVKMRGKDWQCVTSKGNFRVGDTAIYFPIDSILPSELECQIFGPDSKVKLNGSRVKTIKLRGAISQGLLVDPKVLNLHTTPGCDFTGKLKVTQYEVAPQKVGRQGQATSKKQCNPNFRKYTGIENAKNYSAVFAEGEEVSVTEKIHGTNFRAGYVPFYADTLWKKLKKFFGFAPTFEFVYGSHNVQLQSKLLYKGFYDQNYYAHAVVAYKLKDILREGEVVYGEIYGDGVQKNYSYGCSAGERRLVIFDVMQHGHYLDAVAFKHWTDERGLPVVPELYRGPFSKEKVLELRDGNSVLAPNQKIREGVVVKPLVEEITYIGRKVLKFISDDYLLKHQDDVTVDH